MECWKVMESQELQLWSNSDHILTIGDSKIG